MLNKEFIDDVRFRSFFMAGNLVCEYLVLFFKLSSTGWVSLTINEGVSEFTVLDSEPKLLDLIEIKDEFAYPVMSLGGLDKLLGLEILAVYEYRIKDVKDGCIGVYVDFGGFGVSIIESDGCLSIVEGMVQCLERDISLCEMDLTNFQFSK